MQDKLYKVIAPSISLNLSQQVYCILNADAKDSKINQAIHKANEDYLHWEKLKYKTWIPKDKLFPQKESFWGLVKTIRRINSRLTPIKDKSGNYYHVNTSRYAELLHIIDMEMGGNFMGIKDFSENDKQWFINRNIIEEAIASSQLEGANTSREVAKKMLLENRKPRDHSEQMIISAHKTMQKIEQEFYKEELSWELICELHKMITYQTIPEDKQGVLRETLDDNGEELKVRPWDATTIAYITPSKEFVKQELPRLIAFANDKLDTQEFIHPLIKAIMLHFWIGLLHPFEDGNGRLARILFYWYMLKKEYWAFAYLSLSEKIKKSSSQYAMAFIYSEQDDYDLTYFIHYNIKKLKLARDDFQKYINYKLNENRSITATMQQKYGFNERQIKLLQYLNHKTERRITLKGHLKINNIGKVTAASDLSKLVTAGLLQKHRIGRNIFYYPTNRIKQLFKNFLPLS